MNIEFKIHDFEGPLDLLLHLIKESKMDIMNIEMESITSQYLAFLEQQEKMNLEVSSEYLVLAAELLEIKSRLLLPNQKIEEEEEEDPREELVERLLEYQAYRDITKLLQEKEQIRREIHTKAPENLLQYAEEDHKEIHANVSLDDLIDAFMKYYERKQKNKPLQTKVTENEVSVSSRCYEIRKILKNKKRFSFFEVFSEFTKEYVVATFLAILEMTKNQEISIIQENSFGDIICEGVTK